MKTNSRLPKNRKWRLVTLTLAGACCLAATLSTADQRLEVGLKERTAWTTSNVHGTPEPPLPFITERVFPNLEFDGCLDLEPMPGSDRLFVLARNGKLHSFLPSDDVAAPDLVADLSKEIPGVRNTYSIVFHPEFETNRYCFICCIKSADDADGSQIIRFKVRDTEPPTLDIDSQTTIITWPAGGHNGCCLKFGPDGCLYISTGDGVGPNPPDTKRAGQDVSNLLSCILRIDVDHTDEQRNYRIPADNPFVDLPNARGEIWAYGFRNPWRMSFDKKTGDLWVGDVGWELWELLDRVERGGNYGWSVMEGRQPTNSDFPRGPTPILPPTIDHPHSESSSITDGLTYYGQRLPELRGNHIYGDYDTGKLWAFRWTDKGVEEHREIADTTHRIASFGELHNGEFYLVDHVAGALFRLIPNPQQHKPANFPRKLSETGLFQSVEQNTPAAGVVPYSINAPLWSDHGTAERWVAVPNDESIDASKKQWKYPPGTVFVRTLSLEMTSGQPDSKRRLETQLLHFDGLDWRPYTYRWNDAQTDASLVDAGGLDVSLTIQDPQEADGIRRQTWRFAGRAECQRCHNPWSGPALGFRIEQLQRTHSYEAAGQTREASQLATLRHIRVLDNPPADQPQLVDPYDESKPLNDRARSYLHTNCSHCHRKNAGGAVLSEMQHDITLEKSKLVRARPTQGTFGISGAEVLTPGDPLRSVLLYRMSKLGGGRMPHIGSNELDAMGIRLIRTWIEQMPMPSDVAASGSSNETEDVVQRLRRAQRSVTKRLTASANRPLATATEDIDTLLESVSGALALLGVLEAEALANDVRPIAIRQGAKHADVRVRELFERFLPSAERQQRLGAVVRPEQILSLDGDPQRGKELFFNDANACKRCHKVGSQGGDVGPNLSSIGKKYPVEQLLESILNPSLRIEPKYVTYQVETDEGQTLAGVLINNSAEQIVIRDAQNKVHRLPGKSVERLVPSPLSMMPELLFQNMTAQQAADLIAYLKSLDSEPTPK